MNYTSKQYAKALLEIWEEKKPRERTAVLDNFIKLLKKQRAMKKLDFIVQEIEKIYLIKNNLLKAEMATPYPSSKHSLEKVKDFISSFYKHQPNKIILEQKIDKNLIGGFQVKIDDCLIDGSVRNMLLKLNKLISS